MSESALCSSFASTHLDIKSRSSEGAEHFLQPKARDWEFVTTSYMRAAYFFAVLRPADCSLFGYCNPDEVLDCLIDKWQ